MKAKLTKRTRYAKPGQTIVVPMGMILPHAVRLERVFTDNIGQIVGEGIAVEQEGCSTWQVGRPMSVCLAWTKQALEEMDAE